MVPVAHVVYVALTHVPDQSVLVVLWVASTVFKHLFHVDVEPLVVVEAAMVLDIDQKLTQLEGLRDLVILDEVTMLHPLPPLEVHLEVPFAAQLWEGWESLVSYKLLRCCSGRTSVVERWRLQ